MPYNSVDELPKGVKDNLPEHAQAIYRASFNAAWAGTCKDDSNKEECAARVAWAAVKRDYAKDDKGNWAKKSLVNEFSMHITKTSYDKKTGEMRWSAAASDTDKDLDEQAMSTELFDDFVSKAVAGEKVPEPFRSDFWEGGMPYISVSHYPDLDGDGAAGITEKIYRDGKVLKAQGRYFDTELGRACFHATSRCLEEKSETPVRISIGFLDYKHTHEKNNFVFERKSLVDKCPICSEDSKNVLFLKGQLVHLALTRVPANERTSIEAEVTKSMTTREEDAKSIVGDKLAKELDEKAKMVNKSEALVVKADDADVPTPETVPSTEEVKEPVLEAEKPAEVPAVTEPVVETPAPVAEPAPDPVLTALSRLEKMLEPKPVPAHPLDEAISQLKSSYDELMGRKAPSDEVLTGLQPFMDKLGEVIKSSVKAEPAVEEVIATEDISMERVKSVISAEIKPIADALALLIEKQSTQSVTDVSRQNIPQRRSIPAVSVQKAQSPEKPPSATPHLDALLRKTTFIPGKRL